MYTNQLSKSSENIPRGGVLSVSIQCIYGTLNARKIEHMEGYFLLSEYQILGHKILYTLESCLRGRHSPVFLMSFTCQAIPNVTFSCHFLDEGSFDGREAGHHEARSPRRKALCSAQRFCAKVGIMQLCVLPVRSSRTISRLKKEVATSLARLRRRERMPSKCNCASASMEALGGRRGGDLFDMPLGIMSPSAPIFGLWFSDIA